MIVNFNYKILLDSIYNKYNGRKKENKINEFCKESCVKVYRFRKVIEGKTYFQADEIYRMSKILNLDNNEIGEYFFSVV